MHDLLDIYLVTCMLWLQFDMFYNVNLLDSFFLALLRQSSVLRAKTDFCHPILLVVCPCLSVYISFSDPLCCVFLTKESLFENKVLASLLCLSLG